MAQEISWEIVRGNIVVLSAVRIHHVHIVFAYSVNSCDNINNFSSGVWPICKALGVAVIGQAVDVVWGTLEGHFKLGDYQDFQEQYYTEASRTVVSIYADNEGNIQYMYRVPEDYGGTHNVSAYVQGQEMGRTAIEIRPQFEVTPLTGPVGTEITIKATGIGYRKWEDARSVNWDNKLVGFLAALQPMVAPRRESGRRVRWAPTY